MHLDDDLIIAYLASVDAEVAKNNETLTVEKMVMLPCDEESNKRISIYFLQILWLEIGV